MRTIQMTLDDGLVKDVDFAVKKMHISRSAFTRNALRLALGQLKVSEAEKRHRRGYECHPATANEFGVWEQEQAWGDQ